MKKIAIVTGAGGFIGNHLVNFLKEKNYKVFGIDIKKPEFSETKADKFYLTDLRNEKDSKKVFKEISSLHKIDELYMLAADMGGIGYIMTVAADIVHNNLQINLNSIKLAKEFSVKKIFFASSACIYPQNIQKSVGSNALKETDAIPANPDSFYGWEKLMTEKTCEAYAKDYGIKIHIARFHNIYGPEGIFEGGKEKSPAALCRKVAKAKKVDEIEIWGDGQQERSYCYIDDCCQGIYKLMQSNCYKIVNIGSEEKISINNFVDLISKIAKKEIKKRHLLNKPQGVRSRNADTSLAKKEISWHAETKLENGINKTYKWILEEIKK